MLKLFLKLKLLLGVMGLALLLAACNNDTPTEPDSSPTPNTSQTPLAQPNVQLAPAQSILCLAPANPPPPARPAAFSETVFVLVSYLNAGASLSATADLLESWGYLFTDRTTGQPVGGVRRVRVLPGQPSQEVWTYFDPAQADPNHPPLRIGELAVLTCVNGQYQVAYQATADPIFLGVVLNPRLFSDEDVTGDGLGDLSFLTGDCGAGNCVDAMTILSVVGAAMPNMLNTILPDIDAITKPHPTFQFVPAPNSPSKNLWVTPGIAIGAGSGPLRPMTETWAFTGSTFTRTAKLVGPPVYRIHALHDGDEALRRKDLAAAEALYWRVINDPALQSWRGGTAAQTEAGTLAAFAYVRLMQSAAARGDGATARTMLDALQSVARNSSMGEVYAELGQAFISTYAQTNDFAQACAAAIAYATANINTYRALGSDVYGFDNVDYMAGDMCVLNNSRRFV